MPARRDNGKIANRESGFSSHCGALYSWNPWKITRILRKNFQSPGKILKTNNFSASIFWSCLSICGNLNYKIIWVVGAFWLVNKCVLITLYDVSDMTGCLEVVRSYRLMKEIKLFIRASYIAFLFVKLENNNFRKEKKSSLCLHSLVKTKANVWENLRADQWKSKTQSRVFTCSRILTNFAENMFYFLNWK